MRTFIMLWMIALELSLIWGIELARVRGRHGR